MDRKKFSEAQKAILDARGRNILVSAGAGSGKTTVLVQRIIERVILDKVNIDELLVVTFTNAAAMEMQSRLSDAFNKELEKENADTNFLKAQLSRLNMAHICTIDAFCQEVVRQNVHLIDLDPMFSIADTNQLSLVSEQAINDVLEEAYSSRDEDFLALDYAINFGQDDTRLTKLILALHNFTSSLANPDKWLDYVSGLYEKVNSFEDIKKTNWYQLLIDEYTQKLSTPLRLIDKLLNDTNNFYKENLPNRIATIAEDSIMLKHLINEINKETPNIIKPVFSRIGTDKKLDTELKLISDEIKNQRDVYKKLITNAYNTISIMDNFDFSIFNAEKKVVSALIKYVKKYSEHYLELKKQRNMLEFSDIELFCLKLLTDENGSPSDIALKYRNKFTEIIIDEYQDTNELQDTIFRCVSTGSNIFMVGDVKQSIYRFRQSDPRLFVQKYKSYEKHIGGELFLLTDNYRSRPDVLEFCNFIFFRLMDKHFGGITYDDTVSLKPKAEYADSEPPVNKTEIIVIDESNSDDYFENDVVTSLNEYEKEGRLIAESINELISSGFMVKDKSGIYRPLKYSDIAIFMKSTKNAAPEISAQLTASNIPNVSSANDKLGETLEFQTVYSIAALIDNPNRDIELLCLLRSFIFHFTLDELMSIRHNSRKLSFYMSMKKYAAEHSDALTDKINSVFTLLEKYSVLSKSMPVNRLIQKILEENDFYNSVLLMPGGIIRSANLHKICELASNYDKLNESGGINGFYVYLKALMQTNTTDCASVSGSGDAVTIGTIHSSKGLEYPVVYLAGMGKRFNKTDYISNPYIFDKENGICTALKMPYKEFADDEEIKNTPVLANSPIDVKLSLIPSGAALRARSEIDSISEEMRLLYVAMTRAKEKLILVGNTKLSPNYTISNDNGTGILPYEYTLKANSYFDWILPIVNSSDNFCSGKYNKYFDIKVVNSSDITVDEPIINTDIPISEFAEPKLLEKIEQQLSFVYPFRHLQNIPSAVSISEIKRLEHEMEFGSKYEQIYFDKPSFMIKESSDISPARMGTVYHAVFERLDYSCTSEEQISALLCSMRDSGIITTEELNKVDLSKFTIFLGSELAERIRNSSDFRREMPFVMSMRAEDIYGDEFKGKDGSLAVHGVIDLFFIENDEIVLVDYKTDNIKDVSELIDKYSVQLKLYKLALERSTGLPVKETIYYSVKLNTPLSIK